MARLGSTTQLVKLKTKKIFDQRTSEKTLVKQLTKGKFFAPQANGRKCALGDTEGPNDLELDRLNLVDDVRYAEGFPAVPEFTDEIIAVVVAKRGDKVDLASTPFFRHSFYVSVSI